MARKSDYEAFAEALARASDARTQDLIQEHKAMLQSVGFVDWLRERGRDGDGDLDLLMLLNDLGRFVPREDPQWLSVRIAVTEAKASMYR